MSTTRDRRATAARCRSRVDQWPRSTDAAGGRVGGCGQWRRSASGRSRSGARRTTAPRWSTALKMIIDDREGHRHQLADGERRAGVGAVGLGEALALHVLADEGTHDPQAGDLLAQDAVDRVDGHLHRAGVRHHPGGDQADREAEGRHGHRDQPRQAEVLSQGHEDATDHHDGRRHHDRQEHVGDGLHLGDVVGAAADQGRCTERGELRAENFPTRWNTDERTSRPSEAEVVSTDPGRADRRDDLHERDHEHHAAGPDDATRCHRRRPPRR